MDTNHSLIFHSHSDSTCLVSVPWFFSTLKSTGGVYEKEPLCKNLEVQDDKENLLLSTQSDVVLSLVKRNKLFRMREGMDPVCGNLS